MVIVDVPKLIVEPAKAYQCPPVRVSEERLVRFAGCATEMDPPLLAANVPELVMALPLIVIAKPEVCDEMVP